jgi:hypothetical protein
MTPDGEGAEQPDFVVSDGRGRTATPAVTAAVVPALRGMGFQVSVNDPYTGGTIVKRLGAPDRGVHSVQIEINRALYLDEKAVEKRRLWRAHPASRAADKEFDSSLKSRRAAGHQGPVRPALGWARLNSPVWGSLDCHTFSPPPSPLCVASSFSVWRRLP